MQVSIEALQPALSADCDTTIISSKSMRTGNIFPVLSMIMSDFCSILLSCVIAGLIVSVVMANGVQHELSVWKYISVRQASEFVIVLGYILFNGRYAHRGESRSLISLIVTPCLIMVSMEMAELLVGKASPDDLNIAVANIISLLLLPLICAPASAFVAAAFHARPALIVGRLPQSTSLQALLTATPSLGYRCVGCIDPADLGPGVHDLPLRRWLDRHGATHLLISLDEEMRCRVVEAALRQRIPFEVACSADALPSFAWAPRRVLAHGTVLLSSRSGLSTFWARLQKATFDVAVAAFALSLVWPLLLAIAVLCRLDGGPALFAHRRIGSNGRSFACYKFRTMVPDADRVLADALAHDPALAAEWHATRKLANDPRITRVGRFLRRTSADELPQLFNVLLLQMSLVGPRPIVESEMPLYGDDIAHYLATRPGLTGLWQVSGRSSTSYARRVRLDTWYVTNWTLLTDITLILKTIPAVLGRKGAC